MSLFFSAFLMVHATSCWFCWLSSSIHVQPIICDTDIPACHETKLFSIASHDVSLFLNEFCQLLQLHPGLTTDINLIQTKSLQYRLFNISQSKLFSILFLFSRHLQQTMVWSAQGSTRECLKTATKLFNFNNNLGKQLHSVKFCHQFPNIAMPNIVILIVLIIYFTVGDANLVVCTHCHDFFQ